MTYSHTDEGRDLGMVLGSHYRGSLTELWARLGPKQISVFHEQDVSNSLCFVNFIFRDDNLFWVLDVGGEVAGFAWLNGFEHYVARCHYVFFREFYGRTVDLARQLVRQVFTLRRVDGTPVVKTMIGLTPENNRLAVRMIEKVGFKPIITLPDACYIAAQGESVAGIVSYAYYKDWVNG